MAERDRSVDGCLREYFRTLQPGFMTWQRLATIQPCLRAVENDPTCASCPGEVLRLALEWEADLDAVEPF